MYPFKMNPQEYCNEVTKKSHSNFLSAFIFLPKDKKNALIALYAFCREVDDIVDESDEYEASKKKLNWWRFEINQLFENKPQHQVTKALKPYISKFNLSKPYFIEIIDGMEMDLDLNRYKNFKELQLYCYRVASTVGILSAHIFGYEDNATLKYAHNLGIALQLTNIIRDLGDDAKRNRIYIPLEELNKFNITETEILNFIQDKKMEELVLDQAKRAIYFYKLAISNLPEIDKKNQKPGLIMANIYYALLSKIISNQPNNILNQKILLTKFEKFQITLCALFNLNLINN